MSDSIVAEQAGRAGIPPGLRERYQGARSLREFVESAEVNAELWRSLTHRAVAPEHPVARARALPPRRLLVLLEDWCGDAVNTIPTLAAFVDAVPQLELRVLGRDANPDLMNAHRRATAVGAVAGGARGVAGRGRL